MCNVVRARFLQHTWTKHKWRQISRESSPDSTWCQYLPVFPRIFYSSRKSTRNIMIASRCVRTFFAIFSQARYATTSMARAFSETLVLLHCQFLGRSLTLFPRLFCISLSTPRTHTHTSTHAHHRLPRRRLFGGVTAFSGIFSLLFSFTRREQFRP